MALRFSDRARWVKVLLCLLVLLLMVPGMLALLLSSEATSRWAFAQADKHVSGLELDFERGNFWRGWHFARLVWRSEGLELDIDRLEMDWTPSCLLSGRLCIDRLYSRRITVITAASEETAAATTDSQPFQLPDIRLPLVIELGGVTLGELSLDGETTLLSDLHLETGSQRGRLLVHEFSGNGPDVSWHVQGQVAMYGQWPLTLTGQVQLPPVDERAWALDVKVGGSLERLALAVSSEGYLTGQLQGQLEPFKPGLPASLQWQGESFFPYTGVPETLTLDDWTLSASGDLDAGFRVQAEAKLPKAVLLEDQLSEIQLSEAADTVATTAPIRLDLSGLVTTTEASNLRLLLSVDGDPEPTALLTGQVGWKDQLSVDAKLALQQFPWQRLYPVDTGPVTLQTLDASMTLDQGQVKGQLAATVSGEVGPVSGPQTLALTAHISGDQQALDIRPLSLVTPAGSISGKVSLRFAEGFAWQGDLQLHDLNPGVLYAQFPGQLNGSLYTSGRSQDDRLTLEALWDITGRLRQEPLVVKGSLNKPDDTWVLTELRLRQGDNRLRGSAQWGSVVAGAFDIQLNQLHSLSPELRGQIRGKVGLSGSAENPAVALAVTADGLQQGELELGNVRVDLNGTAASHQLQLEVTEGVVQLSAQLGGGLSDVAGSAGDKVWQGQLSDSRIAVGELALQLQQTAALRYQLSDSLLQLGAHCWAYADARLCFNGQQTLLPERKIDLALRDFDLSTLSAEQGMEWMPEELLWDGLLNASLKLTQAVGAAPVADVRITSASGEIHIKPSVQELPAETAQSSQAEGASFPYQLVDIAARLEATTATTRVQIASDTIGLLDINANVSDPRGRQVLEGSYRLNKFTLGFLQPFLPQVSRLEGELNGQGQIRGVLQKPEVGGELVLSGGHVSGEGLPISLEDLTANILISGQRAQVEGQWSSGENGRGELSGHVGWAPLEVALALTGTALPVTVVPYAQLYVTPDLRLNLHDNELELSGSVAIPEGQITVADLPRSAVRLSPDAVIVGEEVSEAKAALGIKARVQVEVGDQLHLDAFGLIGRLAGQLEIRESLTATGDLRLLGGTFQRLGQDLKLRRAILLFAGPIAQPYLNVEAVREVGDVVAGLRLTGSALAPESQVFSEPAMSQEEALSYLLLGRGLNANSNGEGDLVAQAALSLGVAGSAPFTQKVASSLGLKDFELDTEGSGDATQVVASSSITDKLSLRYGVGVFDSSNEIGLRYELTRRLYIEAISGFVSSLDFFYRIDF